MYQTIVLGLGFLLIIGGGYLIKSIDKEGLIKQSFLKDSKVTNILATIETVPGTYMCNESLRCDNSRTMTLSPSGEVQILTSYNNGAELLNENGSWKIEQGGLISVFLTDSTTEHYEIPHLFLIQSVSTSTLSKISFDSGLYPDMHKPIFIKQGE
ncbi:MAG: hypothetical protein WCT07_02815 [Candidatus Paceibacterota bacterium]|jgi:hypothetical protein